MGSTDSAIHKPSISKIDIFTRFKTGLKTETDSTIREEHEPVPANYAIIGKFHDEKLVSIYIELLCHEYNLLFPPEIIQIAFLFYNDQQSFEWIIDIKRTQNEEQILIPTLYQKHFYVQLFNTDIRGKVDCKFSINEKKSSLLIKICEPETYEYSHLMGHASRIYYDITCNELQYNVKQIVEWYQLSKRITYEYDNKKINNISSLRFILSFRILPSLYMRQKIDTLEIHPISKKSFEWKWSKALLYNIKNNIDTKYFSNNFYNEGCYCLWVMNINKKKEETMKIRLMFQFCILSNPFEFNSRLFGGDITIFIEDGTIYQSKLVKKYRETIIEIQRDAVILGIEFTFKFHQTVN